MLTAPHFESELVAGIATHVAKPFFLRLSFVSFAVEVEYGGEGEDDEDPRGRGHIDGGVDFHYVEAPSFVVIVHVVSLSEFFFLFL